ncbi:MAG: BatD family protein, partial [Oscillospiraceae bacterium]|nr:BatD family protein [Oscillospiraceae bacterium]
MAGKIRSTVLFILTLCAVAMCCAPALAAPEPRFRLDMDNLNLQIGNSCSIAVTMENAQSATLVGIEGLENFDVLSHNSSTSINITGGETIHQETLNYVVMPKAQGQFTLKATIQFNGQTYETNTLEVIVTEGSSGGDGDAQELFVKTILSHTESYLGEKIVLSYEVYSQYSVESLGFSDYIAIDGMVVTKDVSEELQREHVYLDGVRYEKFEVKKLILDPIKSGACTIPSFKLQVNVLVDNYSGHGGGLGGLFGFSEPMYLSTEEAELMVKPLPTDGKPDDFSGIVGQLRWEGAYDRDQVNYGDSLILRATASGCCNLDGMKNVFPQSGLPGFTVYETQKSTAESVINNQYQSQKEFEVILVPDKTGTMKIAPVSVPYFDPVTQTYERAEIPGTSITVLGEMPPPGVVNGTQPASTETILINQVSYANMGTDDTTLTLRINRQTLYIVLIALGGLLLLAAVSAWIISRRRKQRQGQDSELAVMHRQLMASQDVDEIYNLFCAMIRHRFALSLKASPRSAVRESLPDAELA